MGFNVGVHLSDQQTPVQGALAGALVQESAVPLQGRFPQEVPVS